MAAAVPSLRLSPVPKLATVEVTGAAAVVIPATGNRKEGYVRNGSDASLHIIFMRLE